MSWLRAAAALLPLLATSSPLSAEGTPTQRSRAEVEQEENSSSQQLGSDSLALTRQQEPEDESSGRMPVEAPLVESIELRSDAQWYRQRDLMPLVELTEGQPYSGKAVAESLRNLNAAGVAGEIAVFTDPGDALGTVRVTFVIWADYRVESVELGGQQVFKRQRLDRQIEVEVGESLVEDQLLRSVFRLQDYHRDRGYLQARVRLEVTVDEERKSARIGFRVEAGEVSRVSAIDVLGLESLDGGVPEKVLRSKVGERYRKGFVEEDAERLLGELVGQGYPLARVEPPVLDYDAERNEMRLSFQCELGPLLKVNLDAPDVEKLKKQGLLPFLGREGYDQTLVVQAARDVTTYFQEKGFYRVDVQWRENTSEPGVLELDFKVEPGDAFELADLRFEGNQDVSSEVLQARIVTSPKRLLIGGTGFLVDSTLEQDLVNLRSYYALSGYAEAQVGPAQVDLSEQGQAVVVIPIVEGPRKRIVDIEIASSDQEATRDLLPRLPTREGGGYHPLLVQESEATLRNAFEQLGYRTVSIDVEEQWHSDGLLVDLRYVVREGPRWTVDRFILRGNRRTRPEVIHRFLGIEPGDPISSNALLEAQRQLFGLGIFSSAEVSVAPGTPYEAARDVIVRVEEGERRRVSYGVGFDTEDGARGVFRYNQANLFGTASSFTLDLRASQRDQQYRLLLRKPSLGKRLTPLNLSVFGIEEEQESFDSVRRGAQVALNSFTRRTRLRLLYTYELVELEFDTSDPLLNLLNFDRDLRDLALSSVSAALFVDYRDDPLDPSRGWSTNLAFDYAFALFDANAEFLKGFYQQTAYAPLGRLGVLAASLRLGAIEPLGQQLSDPSLPSDFASSRVPISERFFAGGRSTHRAYERDLLGLPGRTVVEGNAVGGNGLALVNLDYRFPLAGAVGGSLFFDIGNVWTDWRDINANDVRKGVGLGVRYLSPVGPLRVDIGWKLDRALGEDPYEIFLSFGNAF